MPSDFGERRAVRPGTGAGAHPPPAQAEHLPCPRCDSTNTKFCYYNNYNLSQPRHFCKACRRYWTQGGTLRNIPVGGGTRKSSKRSRPSTSTTSSASSSINVVPNNNPISGGGVKSEMHVHPCEVNLNDTVSGPGSFTSLLGSQGPAGFLALGGYGVGGLGPAPGFDDMGSYGFGGRGIWAFPEVGNVPENGGSGGGAPATWQLNGVDNGLVDADCFAWPELAISMPGQGLK